MSQSLANIVVHLVFSTKGRRQLLRDQERGQIHGYITGLPWKGLDSQRFPALTSGDILYVLRGEMFHHDY